MITKGQSISRTVARALQSARRISGEDHSFDEISTYLKDAGAEVEKYLKDAVYNGTRNWNNFKDLIDDLLPLGVSPSTIASLNDFRQNWYNKSKHDPAFTATTGEVLAALESFSAATDSVVAANLGSSASPLIRSNRRVFHLAAWDHYIGGDTEIHVMPATDGDGPRAPSEVIYVDMSAWEAIKSELDNLGDVSFGSTTVPSKLYDSWKSEDDFLAGGAFEGDYRDLISTLAKYERGEDILSFLKRESDTFSMTTAVLSASVDAAVEGDMNDSEQDAVEAILRIAEGRYAAPRRSKVVNALASIAAKAIQTLPQTGRASLKGPLWLRSERYGDEERHSVARCRRPVFAILGDGRLIARLP